MPLLTAQMFRQYRTAVIGTWSNLEPIYFAAWAAKNVLIFQILECTGRGNRAKKVLCVLSA